MSTIISQLRNAVEEAKSAGWSINAIAEAAGINRSSLQEWYTGSRESLAVETAAGLAAWLGMRLTRQKIPKRPAGN